MKPFYEQDGIVIYHGDCREVLPSLAPASLLLTDPPYGIGQANGMGGGGYDGFGKRIKRTPRLYAGEWDKCPPDAATFSLMISRASVSIIWGGNCFADRLPLSTKWLVWDKQQTMPTYSDCELAWTSLGGASVKIFRYCGSGLLAVETERFHPTQKPVALMKWCLGFAPNAVTVLDPFMGSGTTLRAAKDLGRKAIGIEIEEKYCEIAAKRMSQSVLDFTEPVREPEREALFQ